MKPPPKSPAVVTALCGVRGTAVATALACALMARGAMAENWHSEFSLRAGETWTDNVDLAPNNVRRSDWITEITPGYRLYGSGAHTSADVWAAWANYIHTNRDTDNDSNLQLNARGHVEAVDKHVFVDATAGMTQQSISMFGPQNQQGYNADTNRANVRTASVSPYATWNLGRQAVAQARYRYEWADSDSDALQRQTTQSYDASISSGADWGRMGWGVSATGNHSTGDVARNTDSDSYRAWLSYGVLHDLRVQVFGGQERNDYATDDSLTTTNYGVGLDWAPSARTSLSGDISHRFFGTGYHFRFSQRWRLAAIELGTSRDVSNSTTTQDITSARFTPDFLALDSALRSAIPDNSARYNEVLRQLIARGISPFDLVQLTYLANQYSLEKRLYGSFVLRGARNTVTLSVARTDRRRLAMQGFVAAGGDLSFFDRTVEQTTGLTWTSNVTPLATLLASVSYTHATGNGDSGDSAEQRTKGAVLSLSRKLSPKTDASLTYRYTRQTGSSPYTENAVVAMLFHRF